MTKYTWENQNGYGRYILAKTFGIEDEGVIFWDEEGNKCGFLPNNTFSNLQASEEKPSNLYLAVAWDEGYSKGWNGHAGRDKPGTKNPYKEEV